MKRSTAMRILAPLRDRRIAMLSSGLALSAIGDQLYQVAVSWVAVNAMGSAAGYLSALQAGTLLVTALATGWVDRYDERRVMMAADVARAALLVAFVALWMTTSEPGPVRLIVLVMYLAAGQAFFFPALQVFVPKLVREPRLLLATNALFDGTERLSRLGGPALVGLLAGFLPVVHFFTLDAATFLVSALALLRVGRIQAERPPRRERESLVASVVRGVRATRRDPVLAYSLSIAGLIYGAYFSVMFFALPLTVARHGIKGIGGTSLGAYGLIVASYGSTNLLSALVVGSRAMPARPARSIFGGNLITGAGMCLMGLAGVLPFASEHRLAASCAAAAFSAVGGPMKDVPLTTLRQTLVPMADLGASARAMFIASVGGLLIAMLIAPRICDAMGPDSVVVLGGLCFLGMGAAGLWRFGDR